MGLVRKHPNLELPESDAQLWRHLDFPKFIALLESRALWFSRLDTLGDPFEGLPTRAIVDETWEFPEGLSDGDRAKRLMIARHNTQAYAAAPRLLFVSCWHAAPIESPAMWQIYSSSSGGVAIRTTFGDLDDSLLGTDIRSAPDTQIHLGIHGALVRYVDFDSHRPAELNVLDWASLKREGFSYEREFRLIAFPGIEASHITVPVDLDRLVSEVWVAPTAPRWHADIVRALCRRYELSAAVRQSSLLDHPAYLASREDGAD